MMLDATPTTVSQGPGVFPSKNRRRLRRAVSPGQYLFTNRWLTIATGIPEGPSASLNSRPANPPARSAWKYPEPITRTDILGWSTLSASGMSASWYGMWREPPVGRESAVGIQLHQGAFHECNFSREQ